MDLRRRYRAPLCRVTHLGKIKAHNHSLGNDLANTLANQVADGHPPDTTYTTGSEVTIGHWTWPYTLIPQTLGEPIPYKYTNLKPDAHTYNTKHTHTPLANIQARCPLRPRSGGRRRLLFPQKTHNTLKSNSPTNHNSCGESTTPASSHTTPPCDAPCVANSLAMATWPVNAPPCLG
jgi:hypothetical protein